MTRVAQGHTGRWWWNPGLGPPNPAFFRSPTERGKKLRDPRPTAGDLLADSDLAEDPGGKKRREVWVISSECWPGEGGNRTVGTGVSTNLFLSSFSLVCWFSRKAHLNKSSDLFLLS